MYFEDNELYNRITQNKRRLRVSEYFTKFGEKKFVQLSDVVKDTETNIDEIPCDKLQECRCTFLG